MTIEVFCQSPALKSLKGNWSVEKFYYLNGKTGSLEDLRGPLSISLAIQENSKFILGYKAGNICEWTVAFVGGNNPFQLDLCRTSVYDKELKEGQQERGLIKLEGESLYLHIGVDGRPIDFQQRAGFSSFLLICSRIKNK